MSQVVHVAVGIIFNAKREVLIAFRDKQKHQGALWEFPGGKLEADEDVQTALRRELMEELGLQAGSARDDLQPLLQVTHDYGDKQVLLDIWQVCRYEGEAQGREGQPIRWVAINKLEQFQFPQANLAIVEFLKKELDKTSL